MVLVLATVRGGSGAQGAARALRAAGAGRGPWSAEARPRQHGVFNSPNHSVQFLPGVLTALPGYIGFVLHGMLELKTFFLEFSGQQVLYGLIFTC
jgi:hypothetical protein